MLIGVILAVAAVLVGGGWFGYRYFTKPKSAEDQIRSIVQKKVDEFNAASYTYDPGIVCKQYVANDEKELKEARNIKPQSGTISMSVTSIQVAGNSATADITIKFQKLPDQTKNDTAKFVKEDGKWKSCDPPSSSSDGGSDNGDSGN